jgi:hypothetical protein
MQITFRWDTSAATAPKAFEKLEYSLLVKKGKRPVFIGKVDLDEVVYH